MTDYLVPGLFLLVFGVALRQKQPLYTLLTDGAANGLKLIGKILPSLIVLLSMVAMLRASGILERSMPFFAPVFQALGIPPQLAPLMLVRPFSGSAALAVGLELMQQYGPDSQIGLTAAVMLGSTETTFYTISVYFGAANITKTRHTIAAALIADFTGFICAALFVQLFFPNA